MKNTTKRKIWLGLTLGLTMNLFALDVIKNETNQKVDNINQIENNLKDSSNLSNTMEINKFNAKQKINLVPSSIEKKDIDFKPYKGEDITFEKYTGTEIVLKPKNNK